MSLLLGAGSTGFLNTGGGGGGGTDIMVTDGNTADGSFGNASTWGVEAGFTITGGGLVLATPTVNNWCYTSTAAMRPDVSGAASNTLDFSIDCTSFTAEGQIRFEVRSHNGTSFIEGSNVTIYETTVDGSFGGTTTLTKSSAYSVPATAQTLYIVINNRSTSTDLTLDNFKLTYT